MSADAPLVRPFGCCAGHGGRGAPFQHASTWRCCHASGDERQRPGLFVATGPGIPGFGYLALFLGRHCSRNSPQRDRGRPISAAEHESRLILGAYVYPDLRRLDVRSPRRRPSLRRASAICDIHAVLCRVGDALPSVGLGLAGVIEFVFPRRSVLRSDFAPAPGLALLGATFYSFRCVGWPLHHRLRLGSARRWLRIRCVLGHDRSPYSSLLAADHYRFDSTVRQRFPKPLARLRAARFLFL